MSGHVYGCTIVYTLWEYGYCPCSLVLVFKEVGTFQRTKIFRISIRPGVQDLCERKRNWKTTITVFLLHSGVRFRPSLRSKNKNISTITVETPKRMLVWDVLRSSWNSYYPLQIEDRCKDLNGVPFSRRILFPATGTFSLPYLYTQCPLPRSRYTVVFLNRPTK